MSRWAVCWVSSFVRCGMMYFAASASAKEGISKLLVVYSQLTSLSHVMCYMCLPYTPRPPRKPTAISIREVEHELHEFVWHIKKFISYAKNKSEIKYMFTTSFFFIFDKRTQQSSLDPIGHEGGINNSLNMQICSQMKIYNLIHFEFFFSSFSINHNFIRLFH